MSENPLVTAAKVGLLALILLFLIFLFAAHNDTQEKVVATRQITDEVREQVFEMKRMLKRGVQVTPGDGETTAPVVARETGPRIPGFIPLLETEPERPRTPDDQIDWNAQFRTASLSEPKGFNIYTSDRDRFIGAELAHYIYYPLCQRMERNKDEWKAGLADHVEISPDRTEYYIWLRQGVYWHRPPVDITDEKYAWMKGKHEVTTEDLVFSLDMIFNERADTGSIRSTFEGIEDYRAVDRYALWVKYKEANFYSTGVLLGDLRPLPKWIYAYEEDGSPIDEASLGQRFAAHWFNKAMCGYGPYFFKEYRQNDSVLLERHEDWWGRRPAFRSIRWKLALVDDEPRYNTFMSFDEDGHREQSGYPISSTRLKREILDNDGSSKLLRQLAAREIFIWQTVRRMHAFTGWACRGKFFSDKRVRQAMTLAANRAQWQEETFLNQCVFGTGVASIESPEYDHTVKPWPYDLEKAARLLDEAGWKDEDGNGVREKMIDGEKVEFRFKLLEGARSSPSITAVMKDWRQSLLKIGVVMTPDPVEWNLFVKKMTDREFDACSLAWYLGDDFKPISLWHSKQIKVPRSDNFIEFSHPRVDEICDALETTFDLDLRYKLCHEFHRILHEEQPYTIMWTWNNSVAMDSRFGGLRDPRPFTPRIGRENLWKLKKGPAKYDDDRYERPTTGAMPGKTAVAKEDEGN
ncbi:MAG: ABC transporter substrate-binding protein [Planctomycetota bacterium]|jgi:peptide/nickel transport system substrate-binding protein